VALSPQGRVSVSSDAAYGVAKTLEAANEAYLTRLVVVLCLLWHAVAWALEALLRRLHADAPLVELYKSHDEGALEPEHVNFGASCPWGKQACVRCRTTCNKLTRHSLLLMPPARIRLPIAAAACLHVMLLLD
jgi:hypothetical protein